MSEDPWNAVMDRIAIIERRVALLEAQSVVLRSVDACRVLDVLCSFARMARCLGPTSMRSETIRNATGIGKLDLDSTLVALQEAGFVDSPSSGCYCITDDGTFAIDDHNKKITRGSGTWR